MAEINDLNIVDASNTARFPESQAPSTVNNGARALEGLIARWHKDTNGSVASTGSANAYVFAANQTLSAYYDGLEITFDANFTNTGSATLNVDAVGAATIKKYNDQNLASGDIESGQKVNVIYDGTNWQLQTPVANAGLRNVVEDTTPQLGGDLDLNGNNLDFPTTANISDCLDEDNMASDSATALATQQSIKAYTDTEIAALSLGKVLQVVQTAKTDTFSSATNDSWTDITGVSGAITPAATSSKVLILVSLNSSGSAASSIHFFRLDRAATAIGIGDAASSRTRVGWGSGLDTTGGGSTLFPSSFVFLDSPSTTSSTTYKVQFYNQAGTFYLNRSQDDTDNADHPRAASTITLIEIGA